MTAGGPEARPSRAPSDTEADASSADLLAALWDRHHGTNLERVASLEAAALALLDGDLHAELRDEARGAAHKLAGSLGTFGFDEGTNLARTAEALLREPKPAARELSECVLGLLEIIGPEPSPTADKGGAGAEPAPPSPVADHEDDRPLIVLVSADPELIERFQVRAVTTRRRLLATADVDEALAIVEQQPNPTMLVDLECLESSGLGLLARAAVRCPEVTTYALSAEVDFRTRLDVAEMGADGFVDRTAGADRVLAVVDGQRWRRLVSSASIVVLDHDPQRRRRVASTLDHMGFGAHLVADAEALWTALEDDPRAAVVLGLAETPVGPDPRALCRAIKSAPRHQGLPVVFLPDLVDDDTIEEMYAAGADDFVAPPVRRSELCARVRHHVDRHARTTWLTGVDPVTGVANRRSGEQLVARLLRLAGRRAEPLCLAVVELDSLPAMVRRHGRSTADAALEIVARLLGEHLRDDDVVSRWTDERFVVALYGAETDAAGQRITEIATALSGRSLVDVDGRDVELRTNAGLAEFPLDGTSLTALTNTAERALERARRSSETVRSVRSDDAGDLTYADVVIVDDDEIVAELLIHALETAGYAVRHITDGLTAADLLGNRLLRARLVVMDVGLPGLDGFSVLRELRRADILEATEVLMLTARSTTSDALRALEEGASDFVGKPFNVPVLMERIDTILGRVT